MSVKELATISEIKPRPRRNCMGNKISHLVMIIFMASVVVGSRPALAAHFTNRNEPATFTAPPSETPGLGSYPPPAAPGTVPAAKEPYQVAQDSLKGFEFLDVPWHFGLGPSFVTANNHHDTAASATLRYQFSPSPWDNTVEFPWHIGFFPLSLSVEAGAIFPHT